ncbi:MAG TPA: Asp-tRNA(Asn)/Glu-tRNA(Gln) amidotransferase subunit GatA [Syntrophomonadaceae bacterium]|nr:Asp-tRNA(Asn)/Glu-tRNA(Gln) amidotransferase subunit GatA [Syntrophomonadaceae bacterium]
MSAYKLTVNQLINKVNNKQLSPSEIVESILGRIEKVDGRIRAFITLTGDSARNQAKQAGNQTEAGVLKGIPYALKDNICTNAVRTTCASKMLEDFIPNYDARVAKKLKNAGGILIGKLNMDELAMGTSTELSAFFPTYNPWDLTRVPGGSSGGAAAAVAADEIPFALATDTGGSIRQPASYCGVVGLKPTYGRVSRWGVAALASSLDQVGVLAKNVEDAAIIMNIIAGQDSLDSTSADLPVPDYTSYLGTDIKGMKIGVPRQFFQKNVASEVKAKIDQALKKYEELGAIIEEVSLPHSEHALAAYYTIASAEASTNLARLDGMRYGINDLTAENIEDMYTNNRGLGLGPEVKRRTLFGTFILGSCNYETYYLQALKIRRLIQQDFEQVFQNFDLIISPTTPTTAFKIGSQVHELLDLYSNDMLTVPINMAGLPAISIPCGFIKGLPIGMQIIGKPFAEGSIIQAAYAFEQNTDYHTQKPVLGVK